MRRLSKIALVIMVISLGLLLSTVNSTGRKQIEIPFSTPSGQAGNVNFSIPAWVYAGDKAEIKATITLMGSNEKMYPVTLTARLEAGFEEISPAGEVRVIIQSGSPVELSWLIRTARDSAYPGHLWLWLETDHSKELLLAREFVLESHYYLGKQARPFRVLSAVILGLSSLAFLLGSYKKPQSLKKL